MSGEICRLSGRPSHTRVSGDLVLGHDRPLLSQTKQRVVHPRSSQEVIRSVYQSNETVFVHKSGCPSGVNYESCDLWKLRCLRSPSCSPSTPTRRRRSRLVHSLSKVLGGGYDWSPRGGRRTAPSSHGFVQPKPPPGVSTGHPVATMDPGATSDAYV